MEHSRAGILIEGANVHNLQGVNVFVPHGSFTVLSGPSGSGKSSFAIDTLHAESRRQFIESLSVDSRIFLKQLPKPEIDKVTGLQPSVSIEQRHGTHHPRSIVATITGIHDYLRILYARFGTVRCYKCGNIIECKSPERIAGEILSLPENSRIVVLAPLTESDNRKEQLGTVIRAGFLRVRLDGKYYEIEELLKHDGPISFEKEKIHNIETVIDRLVVREGICERLEESLKLAEKQGEGVLIVSREKERIELSDGSRESVWEDRHYSTHHACPKCKIDYPELEPRMFSFNNMAGACPECEGFGIIETKKCPKCLGARLRPESLSVEYEGKRINEACAMNVSEFHMFYKNLLDSVSNEQRVPLEQIVKRADFLDEIGLDYLGMDRSAGSLSTGELQRVRLSAGLGTGLSGVCYILDEPSIGLHPRDNHRLIKAVRKLQSSGNTVLVLEHNLSIVSEADHIIDFGPSAGKLGGKVTASGTVEEVSKNPESLTGKYLSGKESIPVPKKRRNPNKKRMLVLDGCDKFNLKNVRLELPLGLLLCVTGVSGSGKSTLIFDTLVPVLKYELERKKETKNGPDGYLSIEGTEFIDKLIEVDSSPLGKNSRSTPATYTGLFDQIRTIFTAGRDAKRAGFKSDRFSFNSGNGRCEKCKGLGTRKIEMRFLPDMEVPCSSCEGKRFNSRTLDIRYKNKNIAEVLEMSVQEALEFFRNFPKAVRILECLERVGLGYLGLGQSASTLSGGEAQRVKLADELSRPQTGKTLYVLDEPTSGLHPHDIRKLVEILSELVESGNTVVVIEHNIDVMKISDWIIDLGPESGEDGGEIIACGTPEEIAQIPQSITGRFL